MSAETHVFAPGDLLGGVLEVQRVLGEGGFGVVYLVYDRPNRGVYALKTFRDEFLRDPEAQLAFRREASIWVGLDQHPNVLQALAVRELSGRLFVQMDYVARDYADRSCLGDFLDRPTDLEQLLSWGIQICRGMEHAMAKGIKAHRDLKPANVLITRDGTAKVSDFGMAAIPALSGTASGIRETGAGRLPGLSLVQLGEHAICGTPGYMAPELIAGQPVDVRSDIYGAGMILWQLARGSQTPAFAVPFEGDLNNYIQRLHRMQLTTPIPAVVGPIGDVLERCLAVEHERRYASFSQLRTDLELIYQTITGQAFPRPTTDEQTAAFWANKAVSLAALGLREEAIAACDRAVALDPNCAHAIGNRGAFLADAGRADEALNHLDRAIALEPGDAGAWGNRGAALLKAGRYQDALESVDRALALDDRNLSAWHARVQILESLARPDDAFACLERLRDADPKNPEVWIQLGIRLLKQGNEADAAASFARALELSPLSRLSTHRGQLPMRN